MPLHVLLDLDGTLTDPAEGITRCIAHALEVMGRPVPARDALTRFIGPPLRETFMELLETRDEQAIEGAVAAYRDRFTTHGMLENQPYPRIDAYLQSWCRQGMTLHLATSKPTVYASGILTHFGLREFFSSVHGAELDGRRADKSELLSHLLRTERIAPADAVMIGDRRHDMIGACANDVLPVGVLWGYGSREELIQAGAHTLCATLDELEQLLNTDIHRNTTHD